MALQRKYSYSGSATNTSAQTFFGITSASTIRPFIYEYVFGSSGTPADQAARYQLQRTTAAGTSTAVVGQAIDPADPAPLSVGGRAHSGEPTYTASAFLDEIGINQRVTFRWVAYPGGELVMPSTAANGIGFFVSAVTSTWTAITKVHVGE